MVKLRQGRGKGCLDVGEVADPAKDGIDWSIHMEFNSEGVAMDAPTFVPVGDVRESMSRFKGELLENLHVSSF